MSEYNPSSTKKWTRRISWSLCAQLFLIMITFCSLSYCGTDERAFVTTGGLVLDDSSGLLNAAYETEYRFAPSDSRLEDVSEEKKGWRKNNSGVFNKTGLPGVYWLKLKILNRGSNNFWYLTLGNTRLKYVNFYLSGEGFYQSHETGYYHELSSKEHGAFPVFKFKIPPGKTAFLYIRIQADQGILTPVRIYGIREFGVLGYQILMVQLIYPVFLLLYLLFLGGFLRSKEEFPGFNLAIQVHSGLLGILITVFYFLESSVLSRSLSLFSSGTVLCFLSVGFVLSLRRKRYKVLYFTGLWAFMAFLVVTSAFPFFGLFPFDFFVLNAVLPVFAVEVTALLFFFVASYRDLKKERDDLQKEIQSLMCRTENLSCRDERTRRMKNINSDLILNNLNKYFDEERPYLQEDLSLAQVAKKLGIRADQLSAVLNQRLKSSFTALLRETRVREACRLMDNHPDMNLLEIAYDCGFGSRTSFYRSFKQVRGVSPTEYRRQSPRQEEMPSGRALGS